MIMTSFVSFELAHKTLEDRKDFDTLLIRREFITLYIPFLIVRLNSDGYI